MGRRATHSRFVAAVAAAVIAAFAVAVLSSATAGGSASDHKPQLSEHRLLQTALSAATQNGDPHPTLIQHSEGTRRDANLVDSGDVVPGGERSYLIAERGRFVLENAPRPPGAPAPHGSVLTLVVNASTGRITDGGVSNRYPDLAKLGPVHTDLRRSSASHWNFHIEIQATHGSRGDPSLVANFSPDGSLATARWAICMPPNVSVCTPAKSASQFLQPGASAPGTIFQARAIYQGLTYTARTATRTGRLHATRPPPLEGSAQAGGRVTPQNATWRGGWLADPSYAPNAGIDSGGIAPDFDSLSVEACRTQSGRHCVNLTPQGRRWDFAQQHVRVGRRFIGRYLFAFDEHFGTDTAFAEPGYGSPFDIPPLKMSATVVRSTPGWLVRA